MRLLPRFFGLTFFTASVFSLPDAVAQTGSGKTAPASAGRSASVVESGAVGDGTTLNTARIQSAIDRLAAQGGGTLVVPAGVFLSGAVFLKPGVDFHLEEGAVLKGSPDIADYPKRRTRIEGHYEENFVPALVNADRCDNLRITGPGTIDGSGEPYWQEFLRRYRADKKTKNLDVARPRLMIVENSDGLRISGVTFKDSGFWNLHLYRCRDAVVENARFEVPDHAKCPSTDGIDVDSCQHVAIRGCTFRVDDDCICLKGSKGPLALEDKDSPPVEDVHVSDCTFQRGHGVVTLGSEATVVRGVVVENCKVTGPIPVVRLKLRPDTPQRYEDIHYRNLTLDSDSGTVLEVRPWKQYFDLQGQPPPRSTVCNVTLSNVKGRYGALGDLQGNRGQTDLSDITLENIDVQLKDGKLNGGDEVQNLRIENVTVNGKPLTP